MKNQSSAITLTKDQCFAAYSSPGCTDHVLIQGKLDDTKAISSGFVIKSFDPSSKDLCIISPDEVYLNRPFTFESYDSCPYETTTKEEYLRTLAAAKSAIEKDVFEKVVVSKVVKYPSQKQSVYDLFTWIKQAYPTAFVFLYHIPGRGTWMGASPERLIEKTENGVKTTALAATQRDRGIPLDQTTWNHKEIHEQKVIQDFIEEILNHSGHSFTKSKTRPVRAGQLIHLQTDYHLGSQDDLLEMAQLLHPGPAICGLPQSLSLHWILKEESHHRQDYCGYLGPLNIRNTSSLFVNLRSMRMYDESYLLFVGGGITAGSDPEKEWIETELKTRTLLHPIHNVLVT